MSDPPRDATPAPPAPLPSAAPLDAAVSPLRSPSAWATLLGVTALGLAADLASKHAAFRLIAPRPVSIDRAAVLDASPHLARLIPPHEPVRVIPGLLDFTLVLNPGAVFGIGAGKRWFFILFTFAALAFGVWIFAAWTRPRDRAAHAAVGLLLAGGLGNLYDRLRFACVRDFIHPLPRVQLPFGWRFPGGSRELWPYVSNVADLLLLLGIVLLIATLWRRGHHAHAHAARAAR